MAYFVVAGSESTPDFVKLDVLAETLTLLPDFHYTRIARPKEEWAQWRRDECEKHGWKDAGEPTLVYKTCANGEVLCVVPDFVKLVEHYYGHKSEIDDALVQKIITAP